MMDFTHRCRIPNKESIVGMAPAVHSLSFREFHLTVTSVNCDYFVCVCFQGFAVVTPAVSAVWSSTPSSSTTHIFRAPSTRTSEYGSSHKWIKKCIHQFITSEKCTHESQSFQSNNQVKSLRFKLKFKEKC